MNDIPSESTSERAIPDGHGFFSKISDNAHYQRIQERILGKGYFTDTVLLDHVTVRSSDLVLVVAPNGLLSYAAHVRRARISTTGTRGYRADTPVELNITSDELAGAIPDQEWAKLEAGLTSRALRPRLPEWNALWEAIKKLRPNKAAELKRLEQLRFDAPFDLEGDGRGVQHYCEKDAVGVALAIAEIPFRGVFAELADGLSQEKTLIESLCGNSTEEVYITHDVKNFPGYIPVLDQGHAVEFKKGSKSLTIFNVNRRPAEKAIGVDLIYQNAQYGSFTFIQYKMLNAEGTPPLQKWCYRPDGQFHAEADRMRKARATFAASGACNSATQYRLGSDPFFFKFCRRQHQKMNSGELALGHYVTLSHLDLLPKGSGARGGTLISPDTMERWLTRTDFSVLVRNGWIGTNNITEAMLKKYIEQALTENRSVIVAVGKQEDDEDYEWLED